MAKYVCGLCFPWLRIAIVTALVKGRQPLFMPGRLIIPVLLLQEPTKPAPFRSGFRCLKCFHRTDNLSEPPSKPRTVVRFLYLRCSTRRRLPRVCEFVHLLNSPAEPGDHTWFRRVGSDLSMVGAAHRSPTPSRQGVGIVETQKIVNQPYGGTQWTLRSSRAINRGRAF